jgi:quercetin dioxygenase-like cupin family protein
MISNKSERRVHYPVEGIIAESLVFGDVMHLLKFHVKQGTVMPTHSHAHEQIGYLVKGKMIMTIDGLENEIEAGDSWAIKGNVPHSIRMIEEGLIIEAFSPIRQDYL